MRIKVTFNGDRELLGRLTSLSGGVLEALRLKVTQLALKLEARVKTQKLDGQVLNRITGRLSRSINNRVVSTAFGVRAFVFSAGDVKYAAIHEFGGTINHPGGTAYIINPKKANLLSFVSNKEATPSMPRTKPHQIVMPQRSFLRSSLRDMSKEISLGMKKAVVEAVQRGVQG